MLQSLMRFYYYLKKLFLQILSLLTITFCNHLHWVTNHTIRRTLSAFLDLVGHIDKINKKNECLYNFALTRRLIKITLGSDLLLDAWKISDKLDLILAMEFQIPLIWLLKVINNCANMGTRWKTAIIVVGMISIHVRTENHIG